MVNVAVASGTRGVGRAICGSVETPDDNNLDLEVELGTKVVGINYGDLASAKKTLDDYQIHTLSIPSLDFEYRLSKSLRRPISSVMRPNGCFEDYFGIPKVKSYLTPVVVVLNIQHKVAAIPVTGTPADPPQQMCQNSSLLAWD
ncbi:uncharacterized protein RCO7_05739 [Rhynchosporium graminicola]|uniref:Uncharacterized protein n=1 Tax=Rhynchosporium graminicola TaxID=2792576 RepID=A0A1E1KBL4_9HELO|nr:uncharacterized protein RCO7_05739 [Rhynchosporium commune]